MRLKNIFRMRAALEPSMMGPILWAFWLAWPLSSSVLGSFLTASYDMVAQVAVICLLTLLVVCVPTYWLLIRLRLVSPLGFIVVGAVLAAVAAAIMQTLNHVVDVSPVALLMPVYILVNFVAVGLLFGLFLALQVR